VATGCLGPLGLLPNRHSLEFADLPPCQGGCAEYHGRGTLDVDRVTVVPDVRTVLRERLADLSLIRLAGALAPAPSRGRTGGAIGCGP
jgi:hypothetical protein